MILLLMGLLCKRRMSESALRKCRFYVEFFLLFLLFSGKITATDDIVVAISEQNVAQNVVLYSLGFGNDVDFKVRQQETQRE